MNYFNLSSDFVFKSVKIGRLVFAFDESWSEMTSYFDEVTPFLNDSTKEICLIIARKQLAKKRRMLRPKIRGVNFLLDEGFNPPILYFDSNSAVPPVVALKIAAALFIPRFGGLFFHGALLIHREVGFLLTGISGSGKTAISTEWINQGGKCGSDEAVAVFPDKNGWLAFSTPFWGALKPNFHGKIPSVLIKTHLALSGANFTDIMKCVFEGDQRANILSIQNLAKFLTLYPPLALPFEEELIFKIQKIKDVIYHD